MIVYFSATGNCKYTAEKIAGAFGDSAVSVEGHDGSITLADGEMLGIVTPVYCWELPVIVREYLQKMSLAAAGEHYSFIVTTFGTTPGCTFEEARRILAKKGVELNAGFSVRMPDNWTPVFDLSDPEEVARQNAAAETYIGDVIESIRRGEIGNRMQFRKAYISRFFSDAYYQSARKTKNLYVEDSCVGCGLCAGKCPVQAIEIRDKKPVWVKDRCVLCLRCLHHCPVFAIQYGSGATKKHGQYRNPNVVI